ncbi:MAG: 16S rRNA (uracil(1498)-N(3))-methyltransferase [Gammaproteobacteria bacterium]|nr:16S rRNA (uracil(1498)-N(3))-methyltransferase [Gammaproteobacteria bacterium]
MRIPRIYLSQPLICGNDIELDANALRHVVQVLRLKPGHPLILFNGEGGEYTAELISVERRRATARIGDFQDISRESKLFTHLGLGISKGERMDFALQKAVELGVSEITPLFTEHCVIQLNDNRALKKQEHWQAVIISACEQSGRNTLPTLNTSQTFSHWLNSTPGMTKLILDPAASKTLSMVKLDSPELILAIGPEGGFSQTEINQALESSFMGITLGPRVLRTESAAIASLAAVQSLWGDFA